MVTCGTSLKLEITMSRISRPKCRTARQVARSTIGSKTLYPWYSDWRILQFTCEHCGWTGKGQQAFPNEAGIMGCSVCDHGVGYVQFPSLRDTERAATDGNIEAIRDLPEKKEWATQMETRMSRFRREKLCRIEQLPELNSECLAFTWNLAEHVGEEKEDYQIIRSGERKIWRELAFFDNILRFNEIKHLLKMKYGTRFKSLVPTDRSLDFLTGDHFYKLKTLSWT
jgi:hypothetical protein